MASYAPRILICTVGLPRSGKTTWALKQGYPIVCPDAIRLSCHARPYFAPFEPWTWAMAFTMVEALFQAGHERVIFDAVNNKRKRRDSLRIQGDTFGEHPALIGWTCAFHVLPCSIEECKARAKDTPDLLPVIARMAQAWEPLEPDEVVWP